MTNKEEKEIEDWFDNLKTEQDHKNLPVDGNISYNSLKKTEEVRQNLPPGGNIFYNSLKKTEELRKNSHTDVTISQSKEKYEFHELANLFPLLENDKLKELVDGIKENGQLLPIVIFEGKILDGRNRYNACKLLGIEPLYENIETKDPLGYVLELNLKRRHLNESQRAVI